MFFKKKNKEISGKLYTDLWIPDFDDLNKRLGLI